MYPLTSSDRTALNLCALVSSKAMVLQACKIYSWLGDRQLNAQREKESEQKREREEKERRWKVNKCALVFSWLSAYRQEWKVWPQRAEGEYGREEQTQTIESDRGHAPKKNNKKFYDVLAWWRTMTTKAEKQILVLIMMNVWLKRSRSFPNRVSKHFYFYFYYWWADAKVYVHKFLQIFYHLYSNKWSVVWKESLVSEL